MPAPALSAAAARPSLADPRRALTRFAAPAEITSPSTDVHSPSLLRGRFGAAAAAANPPKRGANLTRAPAGHLLPAALGGQGGPLRWASWGSSLGAPPLCPAFPARAGWSPAGRYGRDTRRLNANGGHCMSAVGPKPVGQSAAAAPRLKRPRARTDLSACGTAPHRPGAPFFRVDNSSGTSALIWWRRCRLLLG